MLKELSIKNFRNLNIPLLKIPTGFTILVGNNGQGKTNLLEAIYFLSAGKSFRGMKKEVINWASEEAIIEADTSVGNIRIIISRNKETNILINGKQKNILYLFGKLPTVIFYPEEINLVSGPPTLRRSWLDRLISTADKNYFYHLLNFYKALKNKNALLKNNIKDNDHLEVWNKNLAFHGAKIWLNREKTLEKINQILKKISKKVAGQVIFLQYKNPVKGCSEKEAQKRFLKNLFLQKEIEQRLKMTIFGPHRDDFEIIIEEETNQTIVQEDLSLFGSRAQQRQAVISLKLVEEKYLTEVLAKPPLILLDDPFSELDTKNRELLISNLNSPQVLLTATSTEFLPAIIKRKGYIVEIEKGEIKNV